MIVDNGGQSLRGVGLPDPRWGHPHWGCQQPGVVCCCGQRHLPGRSSHTTLQVMTKIHNHQPTILHSDPSNGMWGQHHSVRHWALRPHCILVYSHQMFLLAQVKGRLTACRDIVFQLSKGGFNQHLHLFYTQHQMSVATDFPCNKYLSVTRLVPTCLSHLTTLSSYLTQYVSNCGICSSCSMVGPSGSCFSWLEHSGWSLSPIQETRLSC